MRTQVRYAIVAILVVAVALVGLLLWGQWLMFGTPARTLGTMISAGSQAEAMRCYSRRSLSMMKKIRSGDALDYFQFGMLMGGADVEIISEERRGPEAVLKVRIEDAPPYELRFVREVMGWKFDISDKLSMALSAAK